MTTLQVEKLSFTFPPHWLAVKWDDTAFYRLHFSRIVNGIKAVDILAMAPDATLWLIEVKDYRIGRRDPPAELPDIVAGKALDTLAALLPLHLAADGSPEGLLATAALGAVRLRVVLHLELPKHVSRLAPRKIAAVDIQLKLRQKLRCIDAYALTVDRHSMSKCDWTCV